MSMRRMTAAQLDAYERPWKFALFAFGVALVIDLAYLVGTHPRGAARFVSLFIVAASVPGCVIALLRLHGTASRGTSPRRDSSSDDGGDIDISDIGDVTSAFDGDD